MIITEDIMKIRNGFVSNSSSSSFVLAYDKTGIMTDPKDIVAFIDNNPGIVTSISDDESIDSSKEKSLDRVSYNRKMKRPDGAGAAWTEDEDKRLFEEYNSGMKISEMAKVHDRTNGAIRARLRKNGLID